MIGNLLAEKFAVKEKGWREIFKSSCPPKKKSHMTLKSGEKNGNVFSISAKLLRNILFNYLMDGGLVHGFEASQKKIKAAKKVILAALYFGHPTQVSDSFRSSQKSF